MSEIKVRAPDGSVVTFPAGTPDATIEQAMQAEYGVGQEAVDSARDALERYRAANPQDTGATVVRHGEPGYPGGDSFWDEKSKTYIAMNPAEIRARDDAEKRVAGASNEARAILQGASFSFLDEAMAPLIQGGEMIRNLGREMAGEEIPYTSEQFKDAWLASDRKAAKRFAEEKPILNAGLEIGGGFLAPGVAQAGRYVARAPGLLSGSLRGAATGAPIGMAYGAGAAEGGVVEKAKGGAQGLMTGGIIGAAAPPLARMTGSAAGAVGGNNIVDTVSDYGSMLLGRPMTDEGRAVRYLMRDVDPAAAQARLDQGRRFGGDMTLADIGGSNTQSRARVAATRQTGGRDFAQDFADGRRSDMQDYVANLGQRVSPVEATPSQLDEALESYQRAASRPEFDRARAGPPIRIDQGTSQALWGAEGRRAVQAAARAYSSATDDADRAIAQELRDLAARMAARPTSALPGAATDEGLELSVGAADLLSRYLGQAGGTDRNLQRIFGGLGRAIRDQARAQSGDYDAALTGFQARARLGDATEIGDRFMGRRGRTGDFVQAVGNMGDGELQVARAAARNAMETAGEKAGGAPGVLDALATGRGQGRRTEALLGPEVAADLREGGQVGRRMIETGRNVNPRAGSNTYLNTQDGDAKAVGGIIGNIVRMRPLEALGGIVDMLQSQGISDNQAELIVEMALDPARVDEAMTILTTRLGPVQSRRLIERLTPNLAGQSTNAQIRMVEPTP